MTKTERLSARIAALEHQALQAPALEQEAESFERQIEALCGHLQDRRDAIQESYAAARILAHLAEQHDRVLAGGNLLLNASSESMQAELGPHAETDSTTDLPRIPEPTDSTAQTESGDAGHAESNSGGLPATLPIGPDQSTGVDTDDGGDGPTIREQVEAWVKDQHPESPITSARAAAELDLNRGTARTYLTDLARQGVLMQRPGTGRPSRVPAEYRLAQAAVTGAPAVVQEAAPPPPPAEPAIWAQPSLSARIRELMARDPGQTWTVVALAQELGQGDLDNTRTTVGRLQSTKVIDAVPGTSPREYRLAQAPAQSAPVPIPAQVDPPTGTDALPDIPTRLNPDEVAVFDCLRKVPGGLTQRVPQSRLNWSTGRLDKAVQALLKAGHLGRRGDRLVVVPAELASARAV